MNKIIITILRVLGVLALIVGYWLIISSADPACFADGCGGYAQFFYWVGIGLLIVFFAFLLTSHLLTKSKAKRKVPYWLLLLFFFILPFAINFLSGVGRDYQEYREIQAVRKSIVSDSNVSFKTYNNPDYGLEFAYPSSVKLFDEEEELGEFTDILHLSLYPTEKKFDDLGHVLDSFLYIRVTKHSYEDKESCFDEDAFTYPALQLTEFQGKPAVAGYVKSSAYGIDENAYAARVSYGTNCMELYLPGVKDGKSLTEVDKKLLNSFVLN